MPGGAQDNWYDHSPKKCWTCRQILDTSCFIFSPTHQKYLPRCKACRSKAQMGRYWKNREATLKTRRDTNKALRQEVLQAYGGSCRCCGERAPEFLAIDHIYNDGARHRLETGLTGVRFYAWLKRNKFPRDRFQILCHNCNTAKSRYGGCPHSLAAA